MRTDTLEADWNSRLRALTEAQAEHERQRSADRFVVDDHERERILALATNFPAVWADANTPHRERKRMLALPSPSDEAMAQVRSLANDPAVPARLDQLRALVGKRAWRPARKLVDELTPTLSPLAEVTPASAVSDADRPLLVRAAELKVRFDEYRAALAEFEVFDAAHRVLWAPENARKDEARMLASVARRFHVQGEDVKAILILHDRMTAHLAQESAAQRAELGAKCGPEPSRSGWDGSMPAVEQYLKQGAHDPGSVKVRNCAAPKLAGDRCWATVCDVRGKNAFGAMVASTRAELRGHGVGRDGAHRGAAEPLDFAYPPPILVGRPRPCAAPTRADSILGQVAHWTPRTYLRQTSLTSFAYS